MTIICLCKEVIKSINELTYKGIEMENLNSAAELKVGDKVYMYMYDSIDGSGLFNESSFYVHREREVVSVDLGVYTVSDGTAIDKVRLSEGGYGTVLNKPIINIKVEDADVGNNVTYLLNIDKHLTAEEFKELLRYDVQRKLSAVKAFNTNCIKD